METQQEVYDERLVEQDSVVDVMHAAIKITEEMAARHYEQCYETEMCGACTDDTPISGEWGPWMNKKREFDGLIEAVERRVRETAPASDAMWVTGDLSGAYLDAFRDAAADPEDCAVCTHDIISEEEECGHERLDGPGACPVR